MALVLALFVSLTTAQTSYLDFTLSTKPTGDCGRSRSDDATSITYSVAQIPTAFSCFNLNSSNYSPIINFTTLNYDLGAKYEQVYYVHPNDQENPSSNVIADVELLIYNERDCLQANGEDGKLEPYYRWNCFDASGDCEDLDFGVQSFAINPIANENRSGRCVTAEEMGNGAANVKMGWKLGMGMATVCFAMLMS